MRIILDYQATLQQMTPETAFKIKQALTLPNPKHSQLKKMGRYLGNTPQFLKYYGDFGDQIVCPKGFADDAAAIATAAGEDVEIVNVQIFMPVKTPFTFKGQLREIQQTAVDEMLRHDHGVLSAGTGFGKTITALNIISARGQRTLIMVHTKELLHQWREQITHFLGIPSKEIGVIGGGKFSLGDHVTVGMIQTLQKKVCELAGEFGMVVVDECHRCPSTTFTKVLRSLPARYLLGLSATVYRRDGLGSVINFYMGPTRHQVKKNDLLNLGQLCQAEVEFHFTDFSSALDASEFYSKVMSELAADVHRNHQICTDVAAHSCHGIKLVLSDRREHCFELQRILGKYHGVDAGLLIGGLGKKDRENVNLRIKQGTIQVLICTGALIGEGYDLPALESLFLAMPVKFSGRLIQYLGRILRPSPGKGCAHIFDYVDHHVGVLLASAKTRKRTYNQEQIYCKNGLKAPHFNSTFDEHIPPGDPLDPGRYAPVGYV